jgi:hypothetical protein
MKKVLLVSATKLPYNKNGPTGNFLDNTMLGPTIGSHLDSGNIDDHRIIDNNTDGLCKVYNRFFCDKWKNYIVVFVHDDVEINAVDLKSKLNQAIEKFDIIGVAGSSYHSLRQPVLWHNSPRDAWSGAVEHPIAKGSEIFATNHFGQYPKKVLTLDGLLIAVNMEKALEVGLKFDEQFDFHFYDLDFSVTANQLGLSCGTWNISTTHYSHGDFRNPVWQANEQKYIKKWKK